MDYFPQIGSLRVNRRMSITIPPPELQIEFSVALAEIRRLYLQDALKDTIRTIDIASLDRQIGIFVPAGSLNVMAAHGLRAELIFPVPILLETNPHLLGYYRLLYGFSQKVFYTAETGIGPFKAMETPASFREPAKTTSRRFAKL
jgi:hypothetical protein